MNTPDNIFADAYSYIMIITAGIVANIFYNLLSAFLRAVGNSKVPLFFLVFSACLNVLLDLFFIILELYGSGCGMILFKQDEIVRFFA